MEDLFKSITGREISALLNPRLAVLVTCCDQNDLPNILTVAWHTPLSHCPPLVGVSIAPTRYSHALIRNQEGFVMNIVDESLLSAVKLCGDCTGAFDDKFSLTNLRLHPSTQVRQPSLADAVGILECALVDEITTGDHSFFIGEVKAAFANKQAFNNAWITGDGQFNLLQCLQRDQYGSFSKFKANGQSR